ncbi:hypothetical protein [Hoeflea sp.]|uniref:hypothetical protein n=1 Tax=Hoeflea sp. TaxID=1940281 RepID=UPI0019AD1D0F|nr:hypothetical protein [Hoeflea sp.]MBC7285474.1 hypothetical protein [Hoeflea sp.]
MAIYSLRLDETGTDGDSQHTVVAGAVATAPQWGRLEATWGNLLRRTGAKAFHWKEFNSAGDPVFGAWSNLKRSRFKEAQEKIINRNTIFRASVGVEHAVHAEIKDRMKGITGFASESDYSLCLRYLMFSTCEQLVKIDPDCRLEILVEDGPYARGAEATFKRVSAMTGRWKPAKHAHRLIGFSAAPKGVTHSLEAADYIAGEENARLKAGTSPERGTQTLSVLLSKPLLEMWYEGMMREREARRAYRVRVPTENKCIDPSDA